MIADRDRLYHDADTDMDDRIRQGYVPTDAEWRRHQDCLWDRRQRRLRAEDDEQAAAIISHKRGSR
jgi:hypothetical protein